MLSNDVSTSIEPQELNQAATYFCRGCGGPLPEGSKARFHVECRRTDKRRRVAGRRQRQAMRENRLLRRHLRHLNCPSCGASLSKLDQSNLGRSVKPPCDVAQPTPERLNPEEQRAGRKGASEPAACL